MTQVVSFLCDSFAMQVSDRLFTDLKTGKPLYFDNKAVMLNRALGFAYTGLGKILNQSTDDWLVEVLIGGATPDEAIGNLRTQATEALKAVPLSRSQKRHAFVAVGFWPNAGINRRLEKLGWPLLEANEDELCPIVFHISNFTEPYGISQQFASERFGVTIDTVSRGLQFQVDVVGQPLTRDLSELNGELANSENRMDVVGKILIAEVRRTAARNPYVGADLMVTVIPRCAYRTEGPLALIPLNPEFAIEQLDASQLRDPLSVYLAKDSDKATSYAPHLVGTQMMAMKNIYMGDTPPPSLRTT
jgi:hypothetical protein